MHDIVQQENQTSDNTESKEIVVSMSVDVRMRTWEYQESILFKEYNPK